MKHTLLYILVLSLALTACKKNESEPAPDRTKAKAYRVSSIIHTTTDENPKYLTEYRITYNEDANPILVNVDVKQLDTTYSYTINYEYDDLRLTHASYSGSYNLSRDYQYDEIGNLIHVALHTVDGYTAYYDLTYNKSRTHVLQVLYTNYIGQRDTKYLYEYTADGENIDKLYSYGCHEKVLELFVQNSIYDGHKSPMIYHQPLFLLDNFWDAGIFSHNNMMQYETQHGDVLEYAYEYNDMGYPTSVVRGGELIMYTYELQ